jgi:phasin family protein
MFFTDERVPATAQVKLQLKTGAVLADTVMEGMHQVTDLNLNLARSVLQQSNLAARQLTNAEDLRHFMALTAAQLQPAAQRVFDYGYYLLMIASSTQSAILDSFAVPAGGRPGTVQH